MENTDNINNNETKPECLRKAARAFHERNKDNEEHKMKQRAYSKRVYETDKERIIARVRAKTKLKR
jgi:hypothetical protein